jgi:AraC-like DNA-binding protein
MPDQPLMVPPYLDGRAHYEDYTQPAWRNLLLPAHVHRFLEMHLVVGGSAVVVIGDQRVQVLSGTLYWMPPGLEHWTAETSKGFRRYVMSMRPAVVRRVLSSEAAARLLGKSRKAALFAQLPVAELEQLARLLAEVVTLPSDAPSLWNAGLSYALARADHALGHAASSGNPTALHPAVAQAMALMRKDGLHLGRDELAAQAGLSASHLSRLFVQELGQELRDVRNRMRVERAVDLLRDGHAASLTEAALEAGFGSYSQFHRVYSRVMGQSPSQQLGFYASRQRTRGSRA